MDRELHVHTPLENGTLVNSAVRLLPCVGGLRLRRVNSFLRALEQLGVEFLVPSLRNKMPGTMKTWHHVMHSQRQIKGDVFFYHKICDVKGHGTS